VSAESLEEAREDELEATSDPLPPMHDAKMIDDIVASIIVKGKGWAVPTEPLTVGKQSWKPYLINRDKPGVLHVHISALMPRYIKRRLRDAASTNRIYVALTMEGLYDEDVLRILCEIDAYVLVVGGGSDITPVYYLAALADRGIPVEPSLRRELARSCWAKRKEGSNFERGRHFEGLLAFLLSHVRGFRIFARNFNGKTDEIDIVIRVDAFTDACWSESGVPFVIVEAKNWTITVGSSVVTVLIRKLETRRGRAKIGLLFTTSSFSAEAEAEELKEAKGNLCVAMIGPTQIVEWIEADDPTTYLDMYVGRAMLR
jgi:Holliday junction resolvase-like predicted endonuclease